MIKKFVLAAGKTLTPGNGYIWKVLSIFIQLTAVASTATQNCYITRQGSSSEVLAYISNQTAAGTITGQGGPESFSTANYLVTYNQFPVITYNDGIYVNPTLPTGAAIAIDITVSEEPEEA